jgi:hypothetical protein
MNKLKIALTLLTVAIIVGPFAYVLIAYSNNLPGLILPPQFSNLIQNINQNPGQNTGQNPSSPSSNPINLTGSNFQVPQIVGTPQYNPATGDFNVAINATNPLPNEISVEQLSVEIQSKDNSGLLGNISIPQQINIQPGKSSIINVEGVIPQQLYNQINSQNTGNIDINNIILKNLDVTVGGIKVHLDQVDPSQIQSVLGGLGGP